MILPRFDVLVPRSPEEACGMLNEYAEKGVRILAGGTDLLVDLRRPIIPQHIPRCDGCAGHPKATAGSTVDHGAWAAAPLEGETGSLRAALESDRRRAPRYLVSLHKLDGLRGIRVLEDGRMRIGALTTISDIERSPDVRRSWTALAEGAASLGSPLVRNRGTLGGNIANARPAADMAVPTIGLGAVLTLKGTTGHRDLAAGDFPCGPGLTVIRPDELLTFVHYPPPPPHSGSAYYKLANRKALEISTVGVSVQLALEGPGGPIADARIALGAVAPKPILAESAREFLIGKQPSEDCFAEAARAAAGDARPIDDHRGSAGYRREMVEILARRLLETAFRRAGGGM